MYGHDTRMKDCHSTARHSVMCSPECLDHAMTQSWSRECAELDQATAACHHCPACCAHYCYDAVLHEAQPPYDIPGYDANICCMLPSVALPPYYNYSCTTQDGWLLKPQQRVCLVKDLYEQLPPVPNKHQMINRHWQQHSTNNCTLTHTQLKCACLHILPLNLSALYRLHCTAVYSLLVPVPCRVNHMHTISAMQPHCYMA